VTSPWIPPLIVLAFAFAGWAFCAAIMGALPPLVGMDAALAIHLIAGPIGFAALAFAYRMRIGRYSPLRVALVFVGFVMAMDLLVVAILGNLDMFRSAVGTWIPFGLIFLASWGGGTWARRRASC